MATINKKAGVPEDYRTLILDAAIHIVKQKDWQALRMRNIAEEIGFTTPAIYSYFQNKDAILSAIKKLGFKKLRAKMLRTGRQFTDPATKLEKMWLAYWDFAFAEKEFYQLMFGVGTTCACDRNPERETDYLSDIIKPIISSLTGGKICDQFLSARFYAYWAVFHGLIAINFLKENSPSLNREVLMYMFRDLKAA